jgi:hypothetical protein
MKFSKAILIKSQFDELFQELYHLHELWYKINILNDKYSDIAERYKDRYVAEFYTLSNKVLKELTSQYEGWYFNHSKESFLDEMFEHLLESGGIFRNHINIKETVKEILEENISKEMDWRQEFEDTEFDFKSDEFLKEKGVDFQVTRIGNVIDYIKEHDLLDEYYEWALGRGIYERKFNLDDIYGNDWWDRFKPQIKNILRLPKINELIWEQWIDNFPGYMETLKNVEESLNRLKSVANSKDINTTMSAISLALNTAHNSGLMYEHLGLSKEEFEALSNINTSKWDEEMKRFSIKFNGYLGD